MAFSAAVVLTIARAETPSVSAARGMVIYKARAFQSDNAVELLEYRSQKNHPSLTYFVTMEGRRMTVPTGKSEVLFLPYPRKGEVRPEQAMVLLGIARERFPQFQPHYLLFERVWREETCRPAAEIAEEIARRDANRDAAEGFAGWVESLLPQREPRKIPASPLQAATLHPIPTPSAESNSDSETVTPDAGGSDLEGNLEKIQEFYRLSGEIDGAN